MKIIVDLINKSLKVLENEKNIYVGNNNADVLEVYCYNGGYHLENEFVSITGLLSNGRKIGPFTTDSAYDEEYIDGNPYIVANFTLTKQNGFTLSEGQLNITIWHNKTNDSGAIVSKQAIGNLLFNVVKTANVDDNIIITDASGDVIYNFKLEIENIQSAVNSVNSELLLKADKNDIPTKVSQLENDTDYVDSERLTDVVDSLEAQIKRNGGKNYYLSGYTSSNGIRELATTLYDYDEEFQSTNVGKFYVELGDGTIIENLYLKRFSGTQGVNYYLNSIIRENNTIKVYLGTLPRTKMTISDFINKHNQIATIQDIANLVNSAPETLDTLGELAAALEENKDVVEALNNAIGNKADITYVDEKIPTDLLDRVETLETLSDEAVYMEDTEFDVEEETGGSVGSGKEIVEITTPLLKIEQTPYGEHINFEFKNEWNNKYIIYDWSIDQQTFDMAQDLKYIIINSSEKILTNLTILIKVPYMGGIINNDMTYFEIYTPKGFVFVENFFNAKTYHEGCRYLDNDNFNYCRYAFEAWDGGYHFIKIDFDDYGFATVYLFDEYEV